MKFRIHIYLIGCLFISWLSSCTQDLMPEGDFTGSGSEQLGENEYIFDLMVEGASFRTRAVDFTSSGSLRINQVWMGVFNVNTGELVSGGTKTLDYKTINAGDVHTGLIRLNLDTPSSYTNADRYIVVCLANYLGVTDQNGVDLETRLDDLMEIGGKNGKTDWQEFNSIAVDAATAYSSPHNGIVPVLAGFLYASQGDTDETHIKIDQFAETATGYNGQSIELSPTYRKDALLVSISNGKFDISGHLLKLRRLVANINVNISLTPTAAQTLKLTDVSYKRFNMPKAVYIIEKRTTNCIINNNGSYTPGSFAPADKPEQSPNYADHNPEELYYDDSDWIYGNTNGFSFQHFANKHWARNDLNEAKDREKNTKYGTDANGENLYYYHALVNNTDPSTYVNNQDFNNYASYFVIKMHLVDQSTGRGLEAVYTIHEGYTSDELGNEIIDPNKEKTRLKDYVVARNIDYTYNVSINGVNDIYHNVNLTGEGDHNNGQGGKVWQFYYATDYNDVSGTHPDGDNRTQGVASFQNGSFDENKTVPASGGFYKNAIVIDNENPDISFRLYGYSQDEGHIDGYNYNFPQESFAWLTGLWPPSAGVYSHYFLGYQELMDNEELIPSDILNGLLIIDSEKYVTGDEDYIPGKDDSNLGEETQNLQNKWMNLVQFVYQLQQEIINKGGARIQKKYHIKVLPSDIQYNNGLVPYLLKDNYVRALYVADRKGQPDAYDGCTTLVKIFAAAQYPALAQNVEKIKLEIPASTNSDISYTHYNFIEHYVNAIRIPVINGVNQEDYEYKLTINNQDVSGNVMKEDGYFIYNVPIRAIPGNGGEITVKAISKNQDKYEDSNLKTIGKITLLNPSWGYGSSYTFNTDWTNLLNDIKNGTFTNVPNPLPTYGYLTYLRGSSGSAPTLANTNNLAEGFKFNTGNDYIKFELYKPCTIITGGPNGGTAPKTYGMAVYINEELFEGKDFNSDKVASFVIPESKFNGRESITITITRENATGTTLSSISLQ